MAEKSGKADAVAQENGFIFIAFKGDYSPDEKEFENAVWMPSNEVKSINGIPVDQFYANVNLRDYYIVQEQNAAQAEKYFQNAQKIFEEEGFPEKSKKIIDELSAGLEELKNETSKK